MNIYEPWILLKYVMKIDEILKWNMLWYEKSWHDEKCSCLQKRHHPQDPGYPGEILGPWDLCLASGAVLKETVACGGDPSAVCFIMRSAVIYLIQFVHLRANHMWQSFWLITIGSQLKYQLINVLMLETSISSLLPWGFAKWFPKCPSEQSSHSLAVSTSLFGVWTVMDPPKQ